MTLIWTAVDHKQVHFRSWLVGGLIPFLVLCLSICQFTFGKKLVSVACCNALCHLCVRVCTCVWRCIIHSFSLLHTQSWGGTVTFRHAYTKDVHSVLVVLFCCCCFFSMGLMEEENGTKSDNGKAARQRKVLNHHVHHHHFSGFCFDCSYSI